MKRPSLQFYPGDWLHDMALRACSLAARGLWIDMLAFMHQGTPYGYLTLPVAQDSEGTDTFKDILRPILPPILARMVGARTEDVDGLLAELETAGVFSRTAEGVIFSRRMVRDEKVRESRAAGGNESLKNPNVPRPKESGRRVERISFDPSLEGSPSSSSSSSKSKTISSEPNKSASEPVASVITFPCVGKEATEYHVTHQQVSEWLGCFPALDVHDQLRHMLAWIKANPSRRKTAKGMPRFIVSWLGRQQNSAPAKTGVVPVKVPSGNALDHHRELLRQGGAQ